MSASGDVDRSRNKNGAILLGVRAFGRAAAVYCPRAVLVGSRGGNQQEIRDLLYAQCRARPGQADGPDGTQAPGIFARRQPKFTVFQREVYQQGQEPTEKTHPSRGRCLLADRMPCCATRNSQPSRSPIPWAWTRERRWLPYVQSATTRFPACIRITRSTR